MILEITIKDVLVRIHIRTIVIIPMDHNFHRKKILITEGQIPVNGKWVRVYALFIKHKYIWIRHLLIMFLIALLLCNFDRILNGCADIEDMFYWDRKWITCSRENMTDFKKCITSEITNCQAYIHLHNQYP